MVAARLVRITKFFFYIYTSQYFCVFFSAIVLAIADIIRMDGSSTNVVKISNDLRRQFFLNFEFYNLLSI